MGKSTGVSSQSVLGYWYKSRANGALMDTANVNLSISLRKAPPISSISHAQFGGRWSMVSVSWVARLPQSFPLLLVA